MLPAQKYKENMPAIPEHFGDELSPRVLDKNDKRNLEPLYEIGKFLKMKLL